MPQEFRVNPQWFAFLVLLVAFNPTDAQVKTKVAPRLITQPIENSKFVTLAGNTPPEVNSADDLGPVPDSLPMKHLEIVVRLPPEKQAELDRFLSEVQDPKSPNYHKWLTPEEYKKRFSLAPKDIDAITDWLKSQGFQVNEIYPGTIDFSGTAGQVERAFKTQIHYLEVHGVKHFANVNDPQIPEALAPAVSGIASLNDFKPRPMARTEREK